MRASGFRAPDRPTGLHGHSVSVRLAVHHQTTRASKTTLHYGLGREGPFFGHPFLDLGGLQRTPPPPFPQQRGPEEFCCRKTFSRMTHTSKWSTSHGYQSYLLSTRDTGDCSKVPEVNACTNGHGKSMRPAYLRTVSRCLCGSMQPFCVTDSTEPKGDKKPKRQQCSDLLCGGRGAKMKAIARGNVSMRRHANDRILPAPTPANFTVMEMTLCEASPAPAWEGRQGAEAAPVRRGTTVPLSETEIAFPKWRGTNNVNLLNTQNRCAHPEIPTGTRAQSSRHPPAPQTSPRKGCQKLELGHFGAHGTSRTSQARLTLARRLPLHHVCRDAHAATDIGSAP